MKASADAGWRELSTVLCGRCAANMWIVIHPPRFGPVAHKSGINAASVSVVFAMLVFILPVFLRMAFPLLNTNVRDALWALVIILPSLLVLNQYLYYTMRKHYSHILMKRE